MRKPKRIVCTVVVTLLLLVALRLFVWQIITVSTYSRSHLLMPGDRLLICRTAYGLQLPSWGASENATLGRRKGKKGQWMIFNSPADTLQPMSRRRLLIEQCTAVPGDTVWFSWSHRLVSQPTRCSRLYPFVVPGRGRSVQVTPWNAHLLYYTLHLHEKRNDVALLGDTLLLIKGKPARSVRMEQDYYWLSTASENNHYDSRYFGLVPQSHLRGRVGLVLFSKVPGTPLLHGFRKGRTLHRLPAEAVQSNRP